MLGPKRFITGGGEPVPRSVTLIVCADVQIFEHITQTTRSSSMQKENSLGVPNLVSRSRPATRLIIIPANPKVRLQLYPKPDSVAFENPSTDTLKIRKIN